MPAIELAEELGEDFERILGRLATYQADHSDERIQEIIEALDVLGRNPKIGRPARAGKRELVIGRGSHGYVVLYRHVEEIDTIFVLAIRSQREAGCSERG